MFCVKYPGKFGVEDVALLGVVVLSLNEHRAVETVVVLFKLLLIGCGLLNNAFLVGWWDIPFVTLSLLTPVLSQLTLHFFLVHLGH